MKITLNLDVIDVDVLKQREMKDLNFIFPIAIEHNGQLYPSRDWWDFGVVILSWWSWHLAELLRSGRITRFLFMDGPYEVQVWHRRSRHMMELRPLGLGITWEVPTVELTTALMRALETTLKKLEQLKIGMRDQELLKLRLEELHDAIQRYSS